MVSYNKVLLLLLLRVLLVTLFVVQYMPLLLLLARVGTSSRACKRQMPSMPTSASLWMATSTNQTSSSTRRWCEACSSLVTSLLADSFVTLVAKYVDKDDPQRATCSRVQA